MLEQGRETRDKSMKQLQEWHLQFSFFVFFLFWEMQYCQKMLTLIFTVTIFTKNLPSSTKETKPLFKTQRNWTCIAAELTNHCYFHDRQTKQLEVCIFWFWKSSFIFNFLARFLDTKVSYKTPSNIKN